MNSIGQINFDLRIQDETFARNLCGQWDTTLSGRIETIADEVMGILDLHDEHTEINSLEINLGTFMETDFYTAFPKVFREKLKEAIQRSLTEPGQAKTVKRTSTAKRSFDLLCDFLLRGYLPSGALQPYGNINGLFMAVLRSNDSELKRFLETYGHYTSLRQRLVHQMDDPELEKGVELLAPSQSGFICDYVFLLKTKYITLEQPQVTRSQYRYAIWTTIYSYLLCNRSSYFNRKSFLAGTMRSLAESMNIDFGTFTKALTSELQNMTEGITVVPELLLMLGQIRDEVLSENISGALTYADGIYSRFAQFISKKREPGTSSEEILIELLSTEDTSMRLIRRLTEDSIRKLVKDITPRHSGFIIEYAKELDSCNERGVFEGKAGGDFSKVKWTVMFPLILEDRGTGFNRRYYVASVLAKIAARYNLTVRSLLLFLTTERTLTQVDAELMQIFASMLAKSGPQKEPATINDDKGIDLLIAILHNKEALSSLQKHEILRLFRRGELITELTVRLQEAECRHLTSELFPKESGFILSYAASLTTVGNKNRLQGKAAGEFDRLKWIFIFKVTAQESGTSFNRREFVRRTLQGIAAHYNLRYGELLAYFHLHISGIPDVVNSIISDLFIQEQKKSITPTANAGTPKEREELLRSIAPQQSGFISKIVNSLVKHLTTPEVSVRIQTAHIDRLIWEIVFSGFFSNKRAYFDRERFVNDILGRIFTLLGLPPGQAWTRLLHQIKTHGNSSDTALRRILESNSGNNNTHNEPGYRSKTPAPANKYVQEQELPPHRAEPRPALYVDNAGIVIISTYLPVLFSRLGLTGQDGFKEHSNRIKAVGLMRYAVYGHSSFPEHELELDKILSGLDQATPLPYEIELTEKEKSMTDSMLEGVIGNWEKLRNSSVSLLREAFLQREGKLEDTGGGHLELTVTTKSYDMLLDTLPWSYSIIKYSWMERPVHVQWR